MKTTLIFAIKWIIALLVTCPLVLNPVAAKTYRWIDNKGNTVYSQTPPPDHRESSVVDAPPPPAESPEAARKRLQEQIQNLDAQREARHEGKQKAAEEKQKASTTARDCEIARHNLEALRQGTRRLYRNEDGSFSRLSEEEKTARTEQANAYIKDNCE